MASEKVRSVAVKEIETSPPVSIRLAPAKMPS